MRRIISLIAFHFVINGTALAHDVDIATTSVSSTNDNALIYSGALNGTFSLLRGEGLKTSTSLGLTQKNVTFKDSDGASAKQYEASEYSEFSFSAGIDQGVAVGSSIGLFGGKTSQPLATTTWKGIRLNQWLREETLQGVLEVRQTETTRVFLREIDMTGTDTDGVRIVQPEDLAGMNYSLNLTHITTPSTIIKAGYSLTRQSDRPDADAVTAEVRQFITPTRSAVHIGIGHYENVGVIHTNSYVGKVIANSFKTEWHQRLGDKFILMGGYRYYLETENPRAADANIKQLGSDYVYSSLRWRYGATTWVEDASELYGLIGRYQTNIPTEALLVGIGGKIFF